MTVRLLTTEPPRRRPILGNVLAALSMLLGGAAALAMFYAFVFSGGYEGIPEGAKQLFVWFALPTLALAAVALAMRQAFRVADAGGRLLWVALADVVAVAAIVAWWLYVGSLTG